MTDLHAKCAKLSEMYYLKEIKEECLWQEDYEVATCLNIIHGSATTNNGFSNLQISSAWGALHERRKNDMEFYLMFESYKK